MRIQIKGGGWYGCHLAMALRTEHDVTLTEKAVRLFSGASGANPARLHMGPHYPRSYDTRKACRDHSRQFMETYGPLTRAIPHNLYAVAAEGSMLDFETYRRVIGMDLPLLVVENPVELGLRNVEGAIQVSERHVLIEQARVHFTEALGSLVMTTHTEDLAGMDLIIDATFCSQHNIGVARYEPCVTALLEGPTDIAVTIMDGPFPSLYPWDEVRQLSSLTSAKWTPIERCETWAEASHILKHVTDKELRDRCELMMQQMEHYYPAVRDRRVVEMRTAIRAMPGSAADARLCKVVQVAGLSTGPARLCVRAGKIDAVFEAESQVKGWMMGRTL